MSAPGRCAACACWCPPPTAIKRGWPYLRQAGSFTRDPPVHSGPDVHADELADADGNRLELAGCAGDEFDELCGRAEISELPGAPAMLRPSRAMLLAALIEDPGGWLPRPKPPRLADVALLSAGATAEEWQSAVAWLARGHHLSAARVRMAGMSALVPGAVSEDAQRALSCQRASGADRLAHRLDSPAPSLARHLRQTSGSGAVEIVRSLPESLRISWNLASGWQVPLIAGEVAVAERTVQLGRHRDERTHPEIVRRRLREQLAEGRLGSRGERG